MQWKKERKNQENNGKSQIHVRNVYNSNINNNNNENENAFWDYSEAKNV